MKQRVEFFKGADFLWFVVGVTLIGIRNIEGLDRVVEDGCPFFNAGGEVTVHAENVIRNHSVVFFIHVVRDDEEKVETGEKRIWKCNVFVRVFVDVILKNKTVRVVWSWLGISAYLPVDRVRCGNHTAPRVESGMYAGFRNGHGLLLHDFVDGNSINVGHLVEFVYANDAPVCENHSACFQSPFSSFTVGCHGSGKTDTRTSSASRGDCERCGVQHETKHLRFGGGGVSDHEHIDVTTNMSTVWEVLFRTTKKKEEHRLLDVIVATDRRSK